MKKAYEHHDVSELELRSFENIVSRIETKGKSLADGSIMLMLTLNEYEVIDAKWHEFCIYTQKVSGKWRPFFAKCNRKTKGNQCEEYECYVCFKRSIKAYLWQFINRFFWVEGSTNLEPQPTRISIKTE